MRALGLIAALALLPCSCGGSATATDREEKRLADISQTYDSSESDLAAIRRLASEINERAMRAREDWNQAASTFAIAGQNFSLASTEYSRAAEQYREAEGQYRRVLYTVILAAGSDLFLRGVCGPRISTHQYRQQLRAQGVDLSGKDIDHIVARARGGPDRPWNYQPLESSINRCLGANGLLWKLNNSPLNAIDALAKYASYTLLC